MKVPIQTRSDLKFLSFWVNFPICQRSTSYRYPQISGLPGIESYYDQIKHPRTIIRADAQKIKGHSLNGKKLILKPVKIETTARMIRTPTELQLGPSIVELYDTRTIVCASAYTIGLFCRI